jgi:hypothetical protein
LPWSPAVGRRAPADVDRDIEDRSGRNADELGLTRRRDLEMQTAHHPTVHRERMVFLDKSDIDAVLPQRILAKDLGKKTARVMVANRPYLFHFGDFGRNDLHATRVLEISAKPGARIP